MKTRLVRRFAVVALAAFWGAPSSAPGQIVDTIALTGDPAPATATTYQTMLQVRRESGPFGPVMSLQTGLADGSNGLFGWRPELVQMVAITGLAPPAVPTATVGAIQSVALDGRRAGWVWNATLDGTGTPNDCGVWVGDLLVNRCGETVATGTTRWPFLQVAANDGSIGFYADLVGGSLGTGDWCDGACRSIWVGPPGSLQLAVRVSDGLPGAPNGKVVRTIDLTNHFVMNAWGRVAYGVEIDSPPPMVGEGTLQQGLWVGPGNASLVALSGTTSPAGLVYGSLRDWTISNRDHRVAFTDVSGGDQRLWLWDPNDSPTVSLLARIGDAAPGGGTILGLAEPVLNDLGELLVWVDVSGDDALLRWDGDGWSRVVTAGDAPGGDPISGIPLEYGFSYAGQVALKGLLQDGGRAIFLSDCDGTIVRLVRTGDLVEVQPGDFRTVDTVELQTFTNRHYGPNDGLPVTLADDGTLAFELHFSDGSSGFFAGRASSEVCPVPWIFADGFESGDTSGW